MSTKSDKNNQELTSVNPLSEDFISGSGTFDYDAAIKHIDKKDNVLSVRKKRKLINRLNKAKSERSDVAVDIRKNEDGQVQWRWDNPDADSGRAGGVQNDAKKDVGFGGKGFLGLSGKDFDEAYDYMVRNGFVKGQSKLASKKDPSESEQEEVTLQMHKANSVPKNSEEDLEDKEGSENDHTSKEINNKKGNNSENGSEKSDNSPLTSLQRERDKRDVIPERDPLSAGTDEWFQSAINYKRPANNTVEGYQEFLDEKYTPGGDMTYRELLNLYHKESGNPKSSWGLYTDGKGRLNKAEVEATHEGLIYSGSGQGYDGRFTPRVRGNLKAVLNQFYQNRKKNLESIVGDQVKIDSNTNNVDNSSLEVSVPWADREPDFSKEAILQMMRGDKPKKFSLGGILSGISTVGQMASAFNPDSGTPANAMSGPLGNPVTAAAQTRPATQAPALARIQPMAPNTGNGNIKIPNAPGITNGVMIQGQRFVPMGDKGLDLEIQRIDTGNPKEGIYIPDVAVEGVNIEQMRQDILDNAKRKGSQNNSDSNGGWDDATEPGISKFNLGEAGKNISMRPILDYLTSKSIEQKAPIIPLRQYMPNRVSPKRGLSYDQIAEAKRNFAELSGSRTPASANKVVQIAKSIGRDNAAANLTASLNKSDLRMRSRTEQIQRRQEDRNAQEKKGIDNQNKQITYKNNLAKAKAEMQGKLLKQQRNAKLVKGLYSDASRLKQQRSDRDMMNKRLGFQQDFQNKRTAWKDAIIEYGKDSPQAIEAHDEYINLPDAYNAQRIDKANDLTNDGTANGFISDVMQLFNK